MLIQNYYLRLRAAKEELQNAATKSKMAQIALDKCAEEFR